MEQNKTEKNENNTQQVADYLIHNTRSGILLHRGQVPGPGPLPRCQSKMADTGRFERCFWQVSIKMPHYDTEMTFSQ